MNEDHLTFLDEDEDVILEGSDLHTALINMGYSDFNSTPKAKTECTSFEIDLAKVDDFQLLNKTINDKIKITYQYIFQDDELTKKVLEIILEGNILLDDHAIIINNFFEEKQISLYRKFWKWLPLIGSTITTYGLFIKKIDIKVATLSLTTFGFFIYKQLIGWNGIKNLKYFIALQKKLHYLLKLGLKILKRHGKKLLINEIYEKDELISQEKYQIILLIKQLMIEVFENLSQSYYEEAQKILNILPNSLHSTCILTKIKNKNKEVNANINYEELKSYYYTFILVQSEMLFIIAHAYNIRTKDCSVHIPKTNLIKSIKYLTKPLSIYYLKICKIIHNYQSCEIHPIKRVFRGIPNSIWQDIYNHLDLTSQKIQLAYKQITSILESIDFQDEKDHNNLELIESIMERMNEAYKQIENARNFAEFSNLLITKIQHKPINNLDMNESEPLLAMNTDEKIVIINNDLEIEDEVFEEYIKEEYLKPLCENSDIGILQNFKLDKLLAKNFMTELKEALIEKQKSMTERELNALKRMYNKILKKSNNDETKSELSTSTLSESLSPTPPPPPPPVPPPRVLKDAISTNNYIEKNKCTPIPLPRVKMLKSEDIIPNVQKFSINQSIQDFKFPIFTEETFFGSGENSEDDLKNNNEDNEVH